MGYGDVSTNSPAAVAKFPKRLSKWDGKRPRASWLVWVTGQSWEDRISFLLQFISGLDGLQERISIKRIHLVSYRWIEPWILFPWQWVLLIPPMGRKDKQNTSGEDRGVPHKVVKLRKHQGREWEKQQRFPESWNPQSFLNDTLYNWWFNYALLICFLHKTVSLSSWKLCFQMHQLMPGTQKGSINTYPPTESVSSNCFHKDHAPIHTFSILWSFQKEDLIMSLSLLKYGSLHTNGQ